MSTTPITLINVQSKNIRTQNTTTTDDVTTVDVVYVQYTEENGGTSTVTTNNEPRIVEYVNGYVNWSIIAPIVLIGLILLVVASCLYWHSKKEQRRLREIMENQIASEPLNPSFVSCKGIRNSARSVKSSRSRNSSLYERISFTAFGNDKSRMSAHGDRISGTVSQKISTDNTVGAANSKTSRGVCHNSKDVQTFSFNNTSWLTSQSVKDNRMKESFAHENPYFSAPGKLIGNLCNNDYSPDNSPFFPNHNTPTTEYDRSSDRSTYIPHEDSDSFTNFTSFSNSNPPLNPHPSLEAIELSSIATYPDVTFPVNRSRFQKVQQDMTTQPSSHSSYTTSCTSDSLSLPSSISRFHASRLYNSPYQMFPLASTHNSSPMRLNLTLAGSIEVSDHYSDNTSMLPCVGSSTTSAGLQTTLPSNQFESSSNDMNVCDNLGFEPDWPKEKSSSAPTTRRGSITKADVGTSVNEKSPFGTNLFRSWSVTADLDISSLSHLHSRLMTPLSVHKDAMMTLPQRGSRINTFSFLDHGPTTVFDINQGGQSNMMPVPVRKVKFNVPVLVKKKYWV